MEEKVRTSDSNLEVLDKRHNSEMEKASLTDDNDLVNALAAAHWDERQMVKLRLDSDLSNIRDTQFREFREWVMCVHEEFTQDSKDVTSSSQQTSSAFPRSESSFSIEANYTAPVFQESFTITLGAQMKQMHNLRIVAADALDLCRYPNVTEESLPQRLQTSMSLYSNNLCGLVLLTDRNMTEEVGRLCQRSTEFHFPTFEQQLESITTSGDVLRKALEWRKEHKKRKALEEAESNVNNTPDTSGLKNGDFYITRHSNLCEVHVLFHMICDDSVLSGNINSRHPVVMGLRNVLKTASLSDVTTLTIPLLLTLEMQEVMTVAWCMKRAELVFKCVKGFMMEVASWGGAEIKTLQFLVPKDIDQDVFIRLTSMLSGIFRTSNPIRGR